MRLCCTFLALFALPFAASAQSATFDLIVDGKVAGRDVYTLAKDKHGLKLTSRLKYSIHGAQGDYADENKYTDTYAFVSGTIHDQSIQPVMTSYVPNKARTEITVGRVGAGSQATDFFAIHSDFFLLPPFDAGAVQALLFAETQAAPLVTLNVYSPPPGGSDGNGGSAGSTHPPSFTAKWIKGPGVSAVLDGKMMVAQTFLISAARFNWILYADDADNLLECDLPLVKTTYVHAGFKLADSPPALTTFAPN